MKLTEQFQKWGVGVLGAVSLVLAVILVVQFNHMRAAGTRRVAANPVKRGMVSPRAKTHSGQVAKAAPVKQKSSDELSRYDSIVEVDLLKKFDSRPLPELRRDPFKFVSGPTKESPIQTAGAPEQPPQPPPPPPVTLKVMGYSEGEGGAKEAMVSDEDQVFVVHAGDSVGTRYKIIKITPTMVTVEDATLHQAVDLPVPQ